MFPPLAPPSQKRPSPEGRGRFRLSKRSGDENVPSRTGNRRSRKRRIAERFRPDAAALEGGGGEAVSGRSDRLAWREHAALPPGDEGDAAAIGRARARPFSPRQGCGGRRSRSGGPERSGARSSPARRETPGSGCSNVSRRSLAAGGIEEPALIRVMMKFRPTRSGPVKSVR
jgi:hypothetical protein